MSGDCALQLNCAVNARATIKTGLGGSITNKLNDIAVQEEPPAQERLETIFGDGTGTIAISTLRSDIKLAKP